MRLLFLLLGLALVVVGCGVKTESNTPPALKPERFEYAEAGRCDTLTNRGVTIKANYVLLQDGTEAAEAINADLRNRIMSSLTSWLDSTAVAANPQARSDLQAAARLFAADYRELTKELGPIGGCWELTVKSDTVYTSPRTITVRLDSYAYTGGAHPNSYTAFYNFDRQTGRNLSIRDLVSDTTALLPLVEKAFRQKQDIRPEQDLEAEGYFLEDGRFFLPENVGISRDGLVFYYNPYEIGAYALGPIDVLVPYAQLEDILTLQR